MVVLHTASMSPDVLAGRKPPDGPWGSRRVRPKLRSDSGAARMRRDIDRSYSREIVNRKREIGEVFGRAVAVRNFCRECNGWEPGDSSSVAAAVRECPALECHLWSWRNGRVDLSDVEGVAACAMTVAMKDGESK